MPGAIFKSLFSNAAAGNVLFSWPGGKACLAAKATWGGGSLKLQILLPDNVTYFDVPSSTLSADGYLLVDLPAGQYKAVGATFTAGYASIFEYKANVKA